MRTTSHCIPSPSKCLVAAISVFGLEADLLANPTGMTVQSGSATAVTSGSQLTVAASQNAFLNWEHFNIAAGETTIFQQPSASSVVWNRINDANPSQIFGNLRANGTVVLMNSAGFYFGPNAFVNAAGFVVSTANAAPQPTGGGTWEFNGPPPQASIINYGQINVGHGGSAYLIAENVENHGTISAPGGSIGLAAGQQVVLSERPDGRGLSVQVNLPAGAVDNDGWLVAKAGDISLHAQAVNQGGVIQANSVRNDHGVIELIAADNLTLGAGSQISATGDDFAAGSAGGSVTLKSGHTFSDAAGSQISVAGGSGGGSGGGIEISAPDILSLNSSLTARAQAGYTAGKLSLDPDYIILDTAGSDSAGSGTVLAGDDPGGTLDLNVNSAFSGFSQILLQANFDITLADGTYWNLSGSTGQSDGSLTLEAGRNIIFGNTTGIYDFNNWSVNLYAGVSAFAPASPTVTPGAGSIFLNANDPNNPGNAPYDPSGLIETAAGSINLVAGQDIIVGTGTTTFSPDGNNVNTGSITTSGGGSISAHALAGNIDTGGNAQGYFIQSASTPAQAYDLSDGLGGISTGAGGNVTLVAGGNVTSVLPGNNRYLYDGDSLFPNNGNDYVTGGAGAYGNQSGQAGDVTIVAGGNVTGHYLVANGTGHIYAGAKMDASGNPITDSLGNFVLGGTGSAGTSLSNPNLALSLINGGWNVSAANNIILQEVRNPNGDYNIYGGGADHYFDYGLNDYVDLNAGNLVQLGSSSTSLPRLNDGIKVPIIYPPLLNIQAGAGGVILKGDGTVNNDQLILYPSPQGGLTIKTTAGGSLVSQIPNAAGGSPQLFNLIVSDSARHQYNSSSGNFFGLTDHATTPVHLGSETPAKLNISGDMDLILLGIPEAAQITVGGSMNNCGYQGMNLAANDVTSINVTGDINNRSVFTSVYLGSVPGAEDPNLSWLSQAISSSPSATALSQSFFYNATTRELTYENISGVSLVSVLNLLENLTIQVTQNGVPQWQDPGIDSIPVTQTVHVLNAATAQALLDQYNALGAIPSGSFGYLIGGGGQFNISARNADLGTSLGLQSKGAGLYKVGSSYPLANLFGGGGIFDRGADINVNLTGDLTMYSSSISSVQGGDITVYAGGDVNVGSSTFSVNTLSARGIFTTADSEVSVYAGGNININGSRIAAYDGGDVTVESLNGNVDAGSGGNGYVILNAFYVDPVTHQVFANAPTIAGSGILATTFLARDNSYPAPPSTVGNILIVTPNGNINTSAGGVEQLPLNGSDSSHATSTLLAGEQPILTTAGDGVGNNVGVYIYDPLAKTWKLETGQLKVMSVYNPKTKKTVPKIDDTPVLSPQNVVNFGGPFPLLNNGIPIVDAKGLPIYLTPLLDSGGNPLSDGSGHPLYVENLNASGGAVVTKTTGGGKTTLTPFLDPTGLAENVVAPEDVNYNPITDSLGAPVFVLGRDISAKGSGVIGRQIFVDATGAINGLFFGQNVSINSVQDVNVTVLSPGSVDVSGQKVTGKLIGLEGVEVGGDQITADLLSNSDITGQTSGQNGMAQGTAANAAAQGVSNAGATQAVAKKADTSSDDDLKKKGKAIGLAQKVSRVTVLLPGKTGI